MIDNYDWNRIDGLGFAEEAKEGLKSACWKGYEAVGMKTKNGKKVPNCVPVKKSEHKEGDVAVAKMTPNYLPKEPGFSETENYCEANGAMAINQLRVMREKIDIMLGMLYPGDNLPPWCATKLANSSQSLASVADYLRFGVEFSEEE